MEERLGRSVWGYWERKFPRIQLLGADRAGVDAGNPRLADLKASPVRAALS